MCSQAATIEPTAVIHDGNHQFCNAADGGKFLTFVLDGQEYGFEILKVREIFGYMNVTSIPQTPGIAAYSSSRSGAGATWP